jgi:hypothetical protein
VPRAKGQVVSGWWLVACDGQMPSTLLFSSPEYDLRSILEVRSITNLLLKLKRNQRRMEPFAWEEKS